MSSVPVSLNGLRIMPSLTRLRRASEWCRIFFWSEVEDSWCCKPSMVSDVNTRSQSHSWPWELQVSRARSFPFLVVDHRVIWLHYSLSGIWCCAHMTLIKGHHRKLSVPTMNDDFLCTNSWWTERFPRVAECLARILAATVGVTKSKEPWAQFIADS